MKPDLEDFWNIEAIGIHDSQTTKTDDVVKKHFKETLTFEDNRYQVTWPWREDNPDLPVNRDLALGRLKSVMCRMKDKVEVMETYDSIIKDQLNKGVIEKVDSSVSNNLIHYLPHHAVINPQKPTTKLRIVYDASAKSRKENKSLNECLYRGPVMLNDLCGLLLRFRLRTVAIVADIEKAFLQIGLQPDQRDVTRFLWLKDHQNISVERNNIQEYRFCRVPFGIITSPFLLGATVECHLDSYEGELAEKLKRDIYVDNLISGTNSVNEAVSLYHDAKSIFSEASMNLREWTTNNYTVNQFIAFNDRASCDTVKVLGHTWDVEKDQISIKSPVSWEMPDILTKRTVLKQVASVFDPMGLFAPVLLRGKLFLQSLWNKHLDWDDAIDIDDRSTWTSISSDLTKLPQHQINRCVALKENVENVEYFLLCFCDASARAYAAVVYLFQRSSTQSRSDLLFCKTRLAPLKTMTIPRLELMAVTIGVRCIRFVKQELNIQIQGIHLWTDSQCVLKWIESEKDLSVFVANRVKEIKSDCDVVFGYVASKENPADAASRGTTFETLISEQLWWHGPQWLFDLEKGWPGTVEEYTEEAKNEARSELKKSASGIPTEVLNVSEASGTYLTGNCTPFGIKSENYSSISKLLRVTALVIRFINNLKRSSCNKGPLTSSELNEAEKMWIVYSQRKNFGDTYDSIISEKPNNLQKQLGVYLDDQGILRCKGRIDEARISESARRPVLLPKGERFTHLLIEKFHRENMHSGVSQCLSSVRYKFWIPQGRATVRSVIGKCLVCRRHEGGPYKMPSVAPLPKTRVTEATPFSRTGLDYLGPMFVKTEKVQQKVWICLFTCLVTRAVHLELLRDMSTEEFLLGLRRFISQRGCPIEIISDNAQTFKTASNTLHVIWKSVITCEEVQSYVCNKGVKWTFIVELAPWMGGFYERLVSLVKRALRKTLSRKMLDYVQLQTVLKEVEATINSRPLVYVSDDIASTITLTPRHFLSLNPHTGIPELEYDATDSDYMPYESTVDRLLKTWKKGQKLLNAFWKIWRDEYLLSLRERTKTSLKVGKSQSHYSPSVGDVVLVKEDIPRGCWKLGKITHLVTSHDGNIRSAKLVLSSGRTVGRPLNLLFPIEVSGAISENPENIVKQKLASQNGDVKIRKSKRAAAVNAEKKKQAMFERVKETNYISVL